MSTGGNKKAVPFFEKAIIAPGDTGESLFSVLSLEQKLVTVYSAMGRMDKAMNNATRLSKLIL
jgi:hypothetical protein